MFKPVSFSLPKSNHRLRTVDSGKIILWLESQPREVVTGKTIRDAVPVKFSLVDVWNLAWITRADQVPEVKTA